MNNLITIPPKKNPRIVFMGTPEFAVATLGALLINGFDVAAVVTAPDKPAGRGKKLTSPAVKQYAEANILKVLQPVDLRDQEFTEELRKLKPDIIIVVAFRMLPESVWKIPSIGTINLHASLLPQYRGAAPINHVIINGEKVTGVTTFLIDENMDTGNILFREEIPVFPDENAGNLHERLMVQGARLVIKTLESIIKDGLHPLPQSEFIKPGEILRKAPKIYPEDCIIKWDNEPGRIHNFIRGLSPYPGAKSFFRSGNKPVSFKILESRPEFSEHDFKPGHIVTDHKTYIKAACRGGFINILQLKPESRHAMSADEFLRGFRISDFSLIES